MTSFVNSAFPADLVYFTKRVPDTSDRTATRATRESDTRVRHEQHE